MNFSDLCVIIAQYVVFDREAHQVLFLPVCQAKRDHICVVTVWSIMLFVTHGKYVTNKSHQVLFRPVTINITKVVYFVYFFQRGQLAIVRTFSSGHTHVVSWPHKKLGEKHNNIKQDTFIKLTKTSYAICVIASGSTLLKLYKQNSIVQLHLTINILCILTRQEKAGPPRRS